MGVSENNGTPKSSILIGFSILNHPFWDTTIFGNTPIIVTIRLMIVSIRFVGDESHGPYRGSIH